VCVCECVCVVCVCMYMYLHELYSLLLYRPMLVKLSAVCLVTQLNFDLLTYLLT